MFKEWQDKNGGTIQDYERAVGDKAGQHLRSAGVRHELQSLKMILKSNPPLVLQTAIVAHHSKLSEKFEQR